MKDKRSYTIEYEAHSLLFEFTLAKGTKGDLAATAGEETVIGKLDLNNPSQRTTFIKECYQLYPTPSP